MLAEIDPPVLIEIDPLDHRDFHAEFGQSVSA